MRVVEKLRKLISNSSAHADGDDSGVEPVEDQLSDEGRVLRQLVKNDGRVRKSTLLDRTGWAEDKADRVLTAMEASSDVRIISRGDDALICRPGYEPKGHKQL